MTIDDATDFGWAVRKLKQGGRVARSGWNGKGMWLELQVPDEHSKMSLPYRRRSLRRAVRCWWG